MGTGKFEPFRIGHYQVNYMLGQGGMGKVYAGYDRKLDRPVAIKMLTEGELETQRKLLLKEARSTAKLKHDNIVTVYELRDNNPPYIVMEYIEGESLMEYIKKKSPSIEWSLELILLTAKAVHYAHRQGVLHRDIKPANIMIVNQNTPKVMDFGLAKRIDADKSFSSFGMIIGTPAYIPPEQIHGDIDQIGVQSDVYGLGATFYHMITGKPPFSGEKVTEVAMKVLKEKVIPPKEINPNIPNEINLMCLKCLEKKPKRRYKTMLSFAKDIERYIEKHPISIHPKTTGYIMKKWIARNKRVTRTSLIVVLISILTLSLFVNLSLYNSKQKVQFKEIVKIVEIKSKAKKEEVLPLKLMENHPLPKMKSQKETPALRDFLRTIEQKLQQKEKYPEIEKIFQMAEKKLSNSLFYSNWGEICFWYATQEPEFQERNCLIQDGLLYFQRAMTLDSKNFYAAFMAHQLSNRYLGTNAHSAYYQDYLLKQENPYYWYMTAYSTYKEGALRHFPEEIRRGKLQEAFISCNQGARYTKQLPYVYLSLARIFQKKKLLGEAKKRIKLALSLIEKEKYYADHGIFLICFGDILFEENRIREAHDVYTQCLQKSPGMIGAYVKRARCYLKWGKNTKALVDINYALSQKICMATCYEIRSEYYAKKKLYTLAIRDAQSLLTYQPTDKCHYNLSVLYCKIREYRLALQYIEKAIESNPTCAEYYLQRSAIYSQLNEPKKYRESMEKFKKLKNG